ncbi:uncharacterized protein LOC123557243 [Mercenaria mercenaria]|uniref:uncharacterized protein LOC123557243 n=1 Tax=Mercenaria mercenaria TaxID=6596 RepID=UPI00234E76BC|nr:uncharacterized protein LOC123557243 [Mercenaria mercenaria]
MESASIINYLIDIVETKEINNMGKLASLSVLNKLFLKEKGTSLQLKCLNSELTTSLITMLDSGLNELNDPSDAVCISVAMEILSQFSKLPICSIQSLISENVIRMLLDYINSSSKFYQFLDNSKTILSEACEGKQLMGKVKVVAMATEPLEYIHRHTKHKLKRVPDKIKVCKLIDTEYEEDLDVCQYLINKQGTWPGSFPGEVVNEADEWENIIVTQVLDGCMFWAQVGENAIKSVFDIQRQLTEYEDHVRRSSALIGDTVVVYGEIMGNHCYLRAQILSFDGGHVDVFAIDYGYTLRVLDKNIFVLPENLSTNKVKRKISLCSVDGVSPPPYDEGLAHNAAAILVNLCKQSWSAGEILEKLCGIQIIKNCLLDCPRPKLKAQVMTILNNLSCNYKVSPNITNGGFVKILLDIVKSYTEKDSDNTHVYNLHATNDEKLLLARCVLCLTNILYRNVETRSQFYKQQGIDNILRLMFLVPDDDALYYISVKLLRIFLGTLVTKPVADANGVAQMDQLKQYAAKGNVTQRRIYPNDQKSGEHLFEDEDDSDPDHDSQHFISKEKECSVSPIMDSMDRSQGYYHGERVNVYDDEQHELCPQKHINSIHVLSFAKHVCGMLNTGHGGTIYFGIDENSQVFGLELSRDEKDRFRLGVDQHMFSKISPVLLHSQFSIKDIPVIDPRTNQIIPDHFVIEINIRGSKGSIYTMVDGACYYRFGSKTSAISRQDLRQLIAFEEEMNYSDELQKFLTEKQQLMYELQLDRS